MNVKAGVRRALASDLVYPWLRRRAGTNAATHFLTYHTLGADDERINAWTVLRVSDFLRQIDDLRRSFDIVSIDEALARHQNGQTHTERPRVVLTFDDGHTGWFDHLLPLVVRERLPVTLYVATSHIADGKPYWFDRVMNALQVARAVRVDLTAYGLSTWTLDGEAHADNWQTVSSLLEHLKSCDEDTRRACVDAIEKQTATARRNDVAPLRPLSVEQLRHLASSPHVTLGSHTQGHELLDQIAFDEAVQSIRLSRQTLRDWTGRSVDHFAFPNGNYNPTLVDAVRQGGFRSAATTVQKPFRHGDNVFEIPRYSIGRFDSIDRFRLKFIGL